MTVVSDHTAPIVGHFHPINATVVSIDTTADTITVSTLNQGATTQTTYTLDPSATITADGAATPLASLSAGAHVLVTLSATSATTATSIAAFSQIVTGTVTSFDTTADTITVTNHNGNSTTYPVSSTATITINGATGTLAGISDGARVSLKLSALDGKTVTALWVGAPDLSTSHQQESQQMLATVVSVDTSDGTITVSVTKNGSTMQVTQMICAEAMITADGSATIARQPASCRGHASIPDAPAPAPRQRSRRSRRSASRKSGTVTSVDTTANTITIKGVGGTSNTYTVGSSATITLNGMPRAR